MNKKGKGMNSKALVKNGVCALALWLAGQATAQSVRDTVRETVPQVQPALSGEAPPPGASVSGPTRNIGWE